MFDTLTKYVAAFADLLKKIFGLLDLDTDAIDETTSKVDAITAAFDEFLAAIK